MSNDVYPAAVRGLAWPVLKSGAFSTIVSRSTTGVENRIAQQQNPIWTWTFEYDFIDDGPNGILPALNPYSDYRTLLGFILARQGQYDDFLYLDPTDNAVVNGPLPYVTDGNGGWYSPIQRVMGGQYAEDITDLNPLDGSGLTVAITGGGGTAPPWTLQGPGLAIPGYAFGGMYVLWTPWAHQTYASNALIVDPNGHVQKVTAGGGGSSGSTIPSVWSTTGGTTSDGALTWTDQGLITAVTASFQFYFRVRFKDDAQDLEEFVNNMWVIGGDDGKNGKGTLTLVTSRPGVV